MQRFDVQITVRVQVHKSQKRLHVRAAGIRKQQRVKRFLIGTGNPDAINRVAVRSGVGFAGVINGEGKRGRTAAQGNRRLKERRILRSGKTGQEHATNQQ